MPANNNFCFIFMNVNLNYRLPAMHGKTAISVKAPYPSADRCWAQILDWIAKLMQVATEIVLDY